jgi:hypothetical protein
MRRFIIFCLILASAFACLPLFSQTSDSGFSFRDSEGKHLDILLNGKSVARFMYAHDPTSKESFHETYKPYLHVIDPKTGELITKGAGGQFTHHRGIYIGWNRLTWNDERFDLWHMKGVAQVHQNFIRQEASATAASITSLVHWNDREGEPLIKEERSMIFTSLDGSGLLQVDFSTRLNPMREGIQLNGDPEHAGVQYRPANNVNKEATRYFFAMDSADPKKDRDYPWVAETYELEGERYSVIHLNHVENPKGTIYSAYRDYGRFGAFFKKDLVFGDALKLNYRFQIYRGEFPGRDFANQQWNSFSVRGK